MSKPNKPFLVGAFVLGGLLLTAMSIALFGGAEALAKRHQFTAYFSEETKGLRVGSNVMLNGVRIGYVSDIVLIMDADSFQSMSQVTLELLPESIQIADKRAIIGDASQANQMTYQEFIFDAGARAQLATQSFITGQLVVNLVLQPGSEATLYGIDTPHPEIPTIPSQVRAAIDSLESWFGSVQNEINGPQLNQRVHSILTGLDRLVNSPDLYQALAGLNQLINSPETQELDTSLQATLLALNETAQQTSALMAAAGGQFPLLAKDLSHALAQLNTTLDETNKMVGLANLHLTGNSALGIQLQRLLSEAEGAARSTRELFDQLEQHPEALIRGKRQ